MEKTVADLPKHAQAVLKETLDTMAMCFPNTNKEDLEKVKNKKYL